MKASEARTEARRIGASTYLGSPCPKGHERRWTVDARCVQCSRPQQSGPVPLPSSASLARWRG